MEENRNVPARRSSTSGSMAKRSRESEDGKLETGSNACLLNAAAIGMTKSTELMQGNAVAENDCCCFVYYFRFKGASKACMDSISVSHFTLCFF